MAKAAPKKAASSPARAAAGKNAAETKARKAAAKAAPEPVEAEDEDTGTEEAAAEAEDTNTEPTTWDHLLDAARAATKNKFQDQGTKEEDQHYLKAVITAISDDKNDLAGFDSLPEDVQAWYNDNGEAMAEGNDVSIPDGFVSKKGAKKAKVAATEDDGETKAPRKAAAKKAKAPKEPKERKERVRKEDSTTGRIRRLQLKMLAKNPNLTRAELAAHPDMEGINSSTINVQFGFLRDAILDIKAAGNWKD